MEMPQIGEEPRRAENVACLPDSLTTHPLTHSPTLTHPSAFPQIEVCAHIFENIFYKNSHLPTCDFVGEIG